uniref:Calcium-transporting P-type ATPase N-terminal autoinhibitory domain-containing protein n=1 Tax=Fagus sylvatica TaxID=28930 RepID=A0A2N9GK38_FAGSY
MDQTHLGFAICDSGLGKYTAGFLRFEIAGVDGGKLLNQRLGASNLERNLQKAAASLPPLSFITDQEPPPPARDFELLEAIEAARQRGDECEDLFAWWRNPQDLTNYLNENFDVKPKHSSEEVLQKWRNLGGVVKNPRRRFRFTANLSKRYEAAAMRRTNQVGCGPVVMVESQRRPGKRESFAEKRALQDLAGEEI